MTNIHNHGIPWDLLDEIYLLRTYPQCRVYGADKKCNDACEPGPSNNHGSNIFLLPGEDAYLRNRFTRIGIQYKWHNPPPVVVSLNGECPYHVNNICSIHDLRPMICRSYPLRCHKFGSKSLSVYTSIVCPYGVSQSGDILDSPHHRTWIGAWKSVMPYIDDDWWAAFERACPSGMSHLGDIIDPDEESIPIHMATLGADRLCQKCGGTGIGDGGLCELCSNNRGAKRRIKRAVMDKKNRFNT